MIRRSLTNVEEPGFLTTVEFDQDGSISIIATDGPSNPEASINTPENAPSTPVVTPPSRSHTKKVTSFAFIKSPPATKLKT